MGYFRSVGSDKTQLKVSDIERMLETRQKELITLNKTKQALDKKADFRARMLLNLGSTIFLGQFSFIVGGTFVFYSWDIMEPIAYTMMLGNFTTAFFFYALKK